MNHRPSPRKRQCRGSPDALGGRGKEDNLSSQVCHGLSQFFSRLSTVRVWRAASTTAPCRLIISNSRCLRQRHRRPLFCPVKSRSYRPAI
jgi:hypothetical protein